MFAHLKDAKIKGIRVRKVSMLFPKTLKGKTDVLSNYILLRRVYLITVEGFFAKTTNVRNLFS